MKWAENETGGGGNIYRVVNEASGVAKHTGADVGNMINHSRAESLHLVLSHVRLPRVSPYFLHDCVATHR